MLVSFANRIDETVNRQVVALQQKIEALPFIGLIEIVPAYASLAVFYDIAIVRKNNLGCKTAFEFVAGYVEQLISEISLDFEAAQKDTLVIPVYYDGEDLGFVAQQHQLTKEEVVQIHTAKLYRVYMIGFLPGFAYMGKVDERIATQRHESPRTNVPAGAVGIAGFQTGIYPLNSPGGWQVIGQTPVKIFNSGKENPCLLQAGDRVQFVQINKEEFEKFNEY